jgi:hypothetical protein
MLRVAREEMQGKYGDEGWWSSVAHIARDHRVEPFCSLALGPRMGRNAQRLINRRRLTEVEIGVRYHGDRLAVRAPAGGDAGADPTSYHQDMAVHTWQDRVGALMFWIALAEVTPEHGAMRFVTGSHKEGSLGMTQGGPDTLETYPKLLDVYELSPPLHYRPGDATAHHCCTVHGAPANVTSEPRWSFVVGYLASDIRYTGAPSLEGEAPGMAIGTGDLFGEEQFPIVC